MPTRNHIALALMVALALAILAVLPIAKWHSAPSCDARTHIEMIRGVAEHGLPYGKNGAIDRFPELRARWNIVRDGKLWGTYPPLFAYVAAPFFRMGGLSAVSRFNIVMLLVMALVVFVLANRFLGDRLFAAIASLLAISSTPIPATSMDMSPYIIAQALLVIAMWLGLASLDAASQSTGRSRLLATIGGISGGLAVAAHLLTFPMLAGLLLAMAIATEKTSAPAGTDLRALIERWTPTRDSLARAGAMLAGFIFALLPVAALNRLRFHSANPISYGPCPWRSCAETGQDQQHLTDIVLYALPTFGWLAAALGVFFFVRKTSWRVLGLIFTVILPMIAIKELRIHAWQIAIIGWGNVFDLTFIDIAPIALWPDGVGHMLGPWLIRSALQCTPILLLAIFVPWKGSRDRNRALVLAIPSFLLFVSCALRANEPPAFSFGFPFAYLRYTVPASAPLIILAMAAIRDLPWTRTHVLLAVALSVALTTTLLLGTNWDGPLWRRVFLLYGTLATAIASTLTLWRARRGSETARKIAPFAIAAAMAAGVAGTLGETLPAVYRLREDNDIRLDAVAALVPQRFALVGFAAEIDTALAMRATRDIEYIDLYETDQSKGWATFRALIDVWTKDGRPIYALWPAGSDPPSPWPDVAFERIMVQENLYRIRKL